MNERSREGASIVGLEVVFVFLYGVTYVILKSN
jgi:hypothetical protein